MDYHYILLAQKQLKAWSKRYGGKEGDQGAFRFFKSFVKPPRLMINRFWTSDESQAYDRVVLLSKKERQSLTLEFLEDCRREEEQRWQEFRSKWTGFQGFSNQNKDAALARKRRIFEDPTVTLAQKGKQVGNAQELRIFVIWLKSAHAPRNQLVDLDNIMLETTVSRKWLTKLILVYHPDKNIPCDAEWNRTCTDVTKVVSLNLVLTARF